MRALVAAILLVVTTSALWAAELEKGEQVFMKCAVCHTVEESGPNKLGPACTACPDARRDRCPASATLFDIAFKNA